MRTFPEFTSISWRDQAPRLWVFHLIIWDFVGCGNPQKPSGSLVLSWTGTTFCTGALWAPFSSPSMTAAEAKAFTFFLALHSLLSEEKDERVAFHLQDYLDCTFLSRNSQLPKAWHWPSHYEEKVELYNSHLLVLLNWAMAGCGSRDAFPFFSFWGFFRKAARPCRNALLIPQGTGDAGIKGQKLKGNPTDWSYGKEGSSRCQWTGGTVS